MFLGSEKKKNSHVVVTKNLSLFNCFRKYFIYAVPCVFCRFYINIYKPLHIFHVKVISLMILVQEITAFLADIREALAPRIPSSSWP